MNLCADDMPAQVELRSQGPGTDSDAFEVAIAEAETAVIASCDGQAEWPARVAAGINAAIEFAISNPAAARTLTVDSRAGGLQGGSDYLGMIERFSRLLGDGAPRSERVPASCDESIVSLIAAIVSCHIRAGTIDSLDKGDPDLVFLALLPYIGFAEASRWSMSV